MIESSPLDAAYDALSDAVDQYAEFRANPDAYLDSHDYNRTEHTRHHVEVALLLNRDTALTRVLELRETK